MLYNLVYFLKAYLSTFLTTVIKNTSFTHIIYIIYVNDINKSKSKKNSIQLLSKLVKNKIIQNKVEIVLKSGKKKIRWSKN